MLGRGKKPELKDELPTWDEVAQLRRNNQRLAAELRVLREEIKGRDEADSEEAEEIAALEEQRAKLAEKLADLRGTKQELELARAKVKQLEYQMGEVEGRLARALGRELILEKEGEVALLGKTLWSALQFALMAAPFEAPGFGGERVDNSDMACRMRQIRDLLHRVARDVGLKEHDKRDKKAPS